MEPNLDLDFMSMFFFPKWLLAHFTEETIEAWRVQTDRPAYAASKATGLQFKPNSSDSEESTGSHSTEASILNLNLMLLLNTGVVFKY